MCVYTCVCVYIGLYPFYIVVITFMRVYACTHVCAKVVNAIIRYNI